MLCFLPIAAKRQFVVVRYVDTASGIMKKNVAGKMTMTVVTLRSKVTFSGERLSTREALEQLHHEAHEACFIANSVKTEVRCEQVV